MIHAKWPLNWHVYVVQLLVIPVLQNVSVISSYIRTQVSRSWKSFTHMPDRTFMVHCAKKNQKCRFFKLQPKATFFLDKG